MLDEEGNEGTEGGSEVTPEAYAALAAEKEELAEKLAKLEEKDMNFATLRKGKLGALTEAEKEKYLGEELEGVKKQQEEFHATQVQERIDEALDVFAGDDKESREKLLERYNRITDKAVSRKEIMTKMKEANDWAGSKTSQVDQLARAASHYAAPSGPKAEKRFSETERGQEFRKAIGIPDPIESARRGGFFVDPEYSKKS